MVIVIMIVIMVIAIIITLILVNFLSVSSPPRCRRIIGELFSESEDMASVNILICSDGGLQLQ